MKNKLKIICLMLLVLVTVNFTISGSYSASYIKAPFYAIESYNEFNNISQYLTKDNHMYFQWGRVVRDKDDKLQFTTERKYISTNDNSKEYSFPGIISLTNFKSKAPNGTAFFSIFFNGTKSSILTKTSDSVDLLSMSEEDWGSQIMDPAIEFAKENGFDGVSLDFEGIKNNYTIGSLETDNTKTFSGLKDKYSRFLQVFKEKLSDMPLAICIHPTNYNSYNGYDYNEINNICDYVILMAYDFQSNGADGLLNEYSTQPYVKVDKAINAMVGNGLIKPKKLLLGVSLAVMKWYKVQDTKTKKIKYIKAPTSYRLEDVLKLKGTISYDSKTRTSVLTLAGSRANSADSAKYNTKTTKLLNVMYYFENEKSFKNKYDTLLSKYQLGGLTIWRLGIGTTKTWQFILGK